MSRCPTDGPVLKSILGLHRPAADCLLSLSLSLAVSTFDHFLSPPICFSCFYSHPLPPIFSISPPISSPMSISLPLSCPISFSFTFSSFYSLLSVAPSSHLSPFLWPLTVSSHKSLCRLYVSLSITLFFSVQCLLSHSLLVSLSQAVNGEQNHNDRERSLPGPERAGETVSYIFELKQLPFYPLLITYSLHIFMDADS